VDSEPRITALAKTGSNLADSSGCELISPRIQINSGEEADVATRDITASIASAYRLLTKKNTLSDLNKDIPGLEGLLKHKRTLRKL
jgi:hypothetical protein